MAPVGSVCPRQGRPGPQALRQPARRRQQDGHPAGPRCLHPAPGRHQRVGGALGPDRGQRPGRQGHVLRPDGRQGVPPHHVLPIARIREPHVSRAMQASIQPGRDAATQYVLRLGDTCLILGQRIAEWCGHAPVLEEDIALTNMSLDLIGQARALLTHAGQISGLGHDEDQLAFLRDERDYLNPTLVELPRGDFAFTVLRNAMLATFLKLMWQRLSASSDAELAAIAEQAAASGLGPKWSELQADWRAEMAALLAAVKLPVPADSVYRSTGRRGVHSEHMGFILAEMQYLQRAFPGGVW